MRNGKKALAVCIISFILISSVLGFSTYERRQSGFSVFGRTFFGGTENSTFDVDLYWTEDPNTEEWKNVEETGNDIPFGSDVLWEPDKSVTRYFKIKNAGDYDFQYNLGIDVPGTEISTLDYLDEHPIGNVIDVYVCRNINDLSSKEYLGTLSDCFQWANLLNKTSGDDLELEKNESDTCALIFTMQHDAGNEYQGTYDQNNNRTNNIGFKICAGATAPEPDPEPSDAVFGRANNLTNYDNYLYRVGNSSKVPISSLFQVQEQSASTNSAGIFSLRASAAEIDQSLISFNFERVAGSSNLGASVVATGSNNNIPFSISTHSFLFTGTGVIKITMLYNGQPKIDLYFEIVNGTTITSSSATSVPNSSSDIVLLTNIDNLASSITLSNGRTLYGNGYTITSNRSSTAGTSGFINISNGTIDNAILNGEVYPQAVTSGVNNEYYAPGINISGIAYIYDSYISECRYAVSIGSGKVVMKNTTIAGGAVAGIYISGGNVTLENCTTVKSERGGLNGLAVRVASSNCSLTLNGTFQQYNWMQQSELPSSYSSYLSSVYSDSTYAYTYGGKKYVNLGIFFMNDSGNIVTSDAQRVITDNTSNSYGYIEKSFSNYKATVYTAKASMGQGMLTHPQYQSTDNGQYYTIPRYSFDYTSKNYIPKEAGNNNYCYYDTTTEKVQISFDKANSSSSFDWDPMILTVQKYGSSINYTVTMNGIDYTNSTISFTESDDYQVVYTYYDTVHYEYSSETGVTNSTAGPYTHVVDISVNAVEPDVQIHNAAFSYVGTWANAAKKVIAGNNTYVMPDVSATSSVIGSTTVSGTTIYYPIVTVGPTSSNGNSAYSSGKGYYFAPVFSALNITDYNQDTGASQYTYNTSSTTWPRGNNSSTGPNTAYFGYAYEEKTWNNYCPYARSTNTQYYGYGKNNNGLCYTTNEIEKDNSACTHLVQYHYVSTDGTTYYYYIQYSFSAMTYESSSCFTPETMITMSDGTRKQIKDITFDDEILSYNFFTGNLESKDLALIVNHGEDLYKVFNMKFSDGTVLRIIGDHGVFDYTLNKYVYLNESNYKDYIGHKFVKFKENGKVKKVKLTDAFTTEEFTTAYSITSAQNSNAIAQNMLTVAPPDVFYNWIDMGGKMRYDQKQFESDVKKYGLYDYSVFEDYVSYEEYVAFNGAYLKIAVEKGKFTFDDILALIELYGSYMK